MEIRRRRITSTVMGSGAATVCVFWGLSLVANNFGASNSDLPECSNDKCILRPDDRRRPIFLDHGRPLAGMTDGQSVAVIDLGLQNTLRLQKINRPRRRRSIARGWAVRQPRRVGALHFDCCG